MTLDATAATLADEVVAIAGEVLGSGLVGAYLHGSAVLGGLRATSDLDILALVDRPTTAAERRDVVRRLLEISGRRAYRGPSRPVELTVVRADQVRPWRFPPTVELLYGEWLRVELERGAALEPFEMPDLGPEVTILLAHGRALVGPPPDEVFDPVPLADLRRAAAAGIPGLLEDLPTDTRNVVLTLARIWFTVATGTVTSKDAAAAWAIKRLPAEHRGVLVRARDMYLAGRDEDDWGAALPAARAHGGIVVAEIQRYAVESEPAPAT